MESHRYKLEPYKGMSTRFQCPNPACKKKTFSRYIDIENSTHIHPSVGRCNRENKCGYHYTPKQYFQDNDITISTEKPNSFIRQKSDPKQKKAVTFIPEEIFRGSLKNYANNYFVEFLINLFGVEVTNELISKYFIGTSKHWNGSTVFWQIDTRGNVRTGKIMLYDAVGGKRIKKPYNHITWAHKVAKLYEFSLEQCFFGEHLLENNNHPIAIVESEKTAVIASVYIPDFIWIAAGSLSNLTIEKCKILSGRSVILFPDLRAFDKWKNVALKLDYQMSDLLEKKATNEEKESGLDLADYLIRYDLSEFSAPAKVTQPFEITYVDNSSAPIWTVEPKQIIENWNDEIEKLRLFFDSADLPMEPIVLNAFTKITNAKKYIESDLKVIKEHNGNKHFESALHRLKKLKTILEIRSNLN